MKNWRLALAICGFASVPLGLAGCSDAPDSATPGHSPSEHSTPEHWPSDLVDASDKVGVLTSQILAASAATDSPEVAGEIRDGDRTATAAELRQRLLDVVGWVPEVAADTPLEETDWIPIHEASERLSRRLRALAPPWDEPTRTQIEDFRALLLEQAKLIPLPPEELPAEAVDVESGVLDVPAGSESTELEPGSDAEESA
ncbi:MAG: hypothetical protein EA381_19040 [Planctomycetaceae bacterium]|nr:MAG: hypothetical protein EA381_19040 [Planctomycetaceae bacterium]